MSETRIGRKRIRTRAALLRAAHEVMSRRGLDGATILEITETADVGFGTFYGYFPSKEQAAAEVLDCVIDCLGRRNRLANAGAGVTDPLQVIGNSVRLTAQEVLGDPLWGWWLQRSDLLARRMLAGFRPFGLEDLRAARAAGAISPPGQDLDAGWAALNWLLVGAVTDVATGARPASACTDMADAVLRVMGASHDTAARIARLPLPPYPELEVDYTFRLEAAEAADGSEAAARAG